MVWDKCFALSRENRKTFLPESPAPKTPRKLPFFFSLGSIIMNHWLPSWKKKKKYVGQCQLSRLHFLCKNTVEIFTEKVTKNCDLFCDLFCELRFEGQQPLFCKILESLFGFTNFPPFSIFSVNSCPIQTCLVTRILRFFRILCQFLTIFSNLYCTKIQLVFQQFRRF